MSLNGLDLNGQQTSSNHPIYIGKGTENARVTDDGGPSLSSQPQLQPSKDANDPLNWADHKKMVILLTASATSFLADFGSSTGAVTSVVQSNAL